jgi:predicted CXXCH cytochrome family protein
LAGLLASVGIAALVSRERELDGARDLHRSSYETAAECTRCHRDHAESFGRTFHRTMTREARGTDVKAPFAGEQVRYFGVPARMSKRGQTPVMQFGGGAVPEQTIEIALTVGSRRYQQYIGRVEGALVRLPWAYHLEEARWFHMNGAFLTPDPIRDERGIARADYERHVTRWNDNCIFCHNVAPNPGLQDGAQGAAVFTSHVEELGIACEACHGPASEHVAVNGDPYRRYRLHLSERADPTIVNPARLTQERSLDVCGRCHGQRITDDVSKFLHAGDPFVPGDDLSLYSAPLWRDTTLDGEPGKFASRFWQEGTPRLTAYEYQGVLLSPCATGGKMTCLSCHDMHAGDPRGQLRADLDREQLCTQCHTKLADERAKNAHSRHEGQTGCMDCHMPPIVYGVMTSHVSHRIELPEPTRDEERDRPDACTLCHVDRSRAWAVEQRALLWSRPGMRRDEPATFSQAELQLLSGDPVTRALTAARYGGPVEGGDPARIAGLLLDVMEHDPYPGVRHLAYRSLLAREAALASSGYTPEDTPPERAAAVAKLRARIRHRRLPEAEVAALRRRADDLAIDIGE